MVHNDLAGAVRDRAQIFKRLSNSVNHVNNFERTISELAPLSHLIDPETRLDKHSLVAAGNYLDLQAPEAFLIALV